MSQEIIYVFWTCRDDVEAKKIIHKLLDHKLIACASIFPAVTSIYPWNNKIEEATETKVILKTIKNHFQNITTIIAEIGSYEISEISAIEISQISPKYQNWIRQNT